MGVMKTMILSDIDFDFFARLRTIDPTLYDQLFANENPANLDARAKALYSLRTMFDTAIDDGHISDSMVYGIALAYGPKWVGYKKVLDVDFETATNPYQMKTTHTTTTTGKTTTTANDTDNNDIYAFDSVDTSHDSKKTSESENDETRNSNSTSDTTVSGNKGNMTYADIARSQMRLIQIRLIDTIISDVIGELTLSIYE